VIPTKISRRISLDRTSWVQRMVAQIRLFPLSDPHSFMADSRTMLASEYKGIADGLAACGVLAPAQAGLLKILAGYGNRLVHYCHEFSADELYEICSGKLQDLLHLVDALRRWVDAHPQLVDSSL
jgi:uncharacterized protein YutE (UPF0331/DUF86 family)